MKYYTRNDLQLFSLSLRTAMSSPRNVVDDHYVLWVVDKTTISFIEGTRCDLTICGPFLLYGPLSFIVFCS